VLTNLELRDLITEVGRGAGPGQPKLYGTTMRFLHVIGLESLDHLPRPRLEPNDVGAESSAHQRTSRQTKND
jgi:chromosome segregation and condensation protein ScpB